PTYAVPPPLPVSQPLSPSCPTRRSSVLGRHAARFNRHLHPVRLSDCEFSAAKQPHQRRAAGLHQHRAGGLPHDVDEVVLLKKIRSEGHTSELQSRVDLVCRLLLEKKNLV